uniref:Muscle M-line assembly protein unc-89-like isoform X3 n=1 Tax=Rhizophora mucronata TaxID=61149 RepID=A0A2P2LMJ0_RHIMU
MVNKLLIFPGLKSSGNSVLLN